MANLENCIIISDDDANDHADGKFTKQVYFLANLKATVTKPNFMTATIDERDEELLRISLMSLTLRVQSLIKFEEEVDG